MAVEQFSSGDTGKPFYQVWIDAVTKPTVENYREIVNDPKATLATAVVWLAAVGFIGSLISGTLQSVFGHNSIVTDFFGSEYVVRTGFMSVIGGAFGSLFFTPIVGLIGTGVVHLVARALGGTGSFEKIFYGFAAFWVPISLVNAVIGGIPVINCLSVFILIYALVLSVIANQAVYAYETWKAVVSSLGVPILLFFVVFSCILILVALGVASVAPIFENIIDQIGFILLG